MNSVTLSQLRFPVQYIEVTEALVRSRRGDQLMASVRIAVDHCLPHEPPALQILRHFPLTAHGTLGVFAITSQTVAEALDAALRYHALVMPLFDFRRLPDSPQGAHVRVAPTVDVGPFNALMAELVIGVLRNVAPYTTLATPVLHAEFAHTTSWPLQMYTDFFGAAPRFGAPWHGFTVPKAMLEAPLITGNRATRAHLEAVMLRDAPAAAQARPLTQRVRQMLLEGLRKGVMPHAEALSHELAMSARTLSRRLQDEGQSLSQLTQQVRIERAEHLLREGRLGLQEIASRAGFSDASSFSRAFKRATGQTPAELRDRLR